MSTDGLAAAIEAAARATSEHFLDIGDVDADGHTGCICGQWRDSTETDSWDEHMADVGIRAAAPHIRRAVLTEAADALDAFGCGVSAGNLLRFRAEAEVTG